VHDGKDLSNTWFEAGSEGVMDSKSGEPTENDDLALCDTLPSLRMSKIMLNSSQCY